MITQKQFQLVRWLIKVKLWEPYQQMRIWCFKKKRGTHWIHRWMLRTMTRDNRHHAPCCPANHYGYTRIVFQHCACGAPTDKTE